jgi:hypothetical protein
LDSVSLELCLTVLCRAEQATSNLRGIALQHLASFVSVVTAKDYIEVTECCDRSILRGTVIKNGFLYQ